MYLNIYILKLYINSFLTRFNEKKILIHEALCDSVNTSNVMKEISNLISSANCYMSANYNLPTFNHKLLIDIALYITNLMRVMKNSSYYNYDSFNSLKYLS